MIRRILISISMALATATPANAFPPAVHPAPPAAAPCPQFYLGGVPPAEVTAGTGEQLFCHSFFVTNYSTTRRDPVWTSYHLTAAMARGSDAFPRHGRTFAQQVGLAGSLQGNDRDFLHQAFARGHMTPDNDAPDLATQADTYVVTNIVPQVGPFNGGVWARLEAAVHGIAESDGDVFIVTGPIFTTPRPPMNGIAVPSALFKAIFVPSRGFALAFISTNANPTVCRIVAIATVQAEANIDPFPSLPAATKATLPTRPAGWGGFPPACH